MTKVSWMWRGKKYSGTLIPSKEDKDNRYARTEKGNIKILPKEKSKAKAKPKPKKKGTHKMPDGTVMSGSTHSKDSKPVKKNNKKKLKSEY